MLMMKRAAFAAGFVVLGAILAYATTGRVVGELVELRNSGGFLERRYCVVFPAFAVCEAGIVGVDLDGGR